MAADQNVLRRGNSVHRQFKKDILGGEDDTASEISTAQLTPSDTTATDNREAGIYNGPPEPGRSYVIRIKNTDRAVTLTKNGLCLEETNGVHKPSNRWLCHEQGVFFGFYNEGAKVFIGHDGRETNAKMLARAKRMDDWERLIARHHRSGGYELLSPHWYKDKQIVKATECGTRLERTVYGHALWTFEECPTSVMSAGY